VNDHDKSQAAVQQSEYAREMAQLLNLLEGVDRQITPEHIAQRFHELLDDIGDDGHPAPPALIDRMDAMHDSRNPEGPAEARERAARIEAEARDRGEVAVRPEPDRRQAMSLVSDALTAVIPDLAVETLDGRQELCTDLGLDSLGLARVLIELEAKLGVQVVDEYLMTIEFVTVADLVALVEHSAFDREVKVPHPFVFRG
jgi:acyl carrier protein